MKYFKRTLTSTLTSTRTSTSTVETYDKKLHFSVRESGHFLFPAVYICSFGRGIRFSGLNCIIPTSRGRKSRVSISYRRISYRTSPPYSLNNFRFSTDSDGKNGFCRSRSIGSDLRILQVPAILMKHLAELEMSSLYARPLILVKIFRFHINKSDSKTQV